MPSKDTNDQVDALAHDIVHEEVLDFAITEPRFADMDWDDSHIDWAAELDGFQGPVDEILEVVDKWEHSTIDEFVSNHRDLQLDKLRMVVNGKSFEVGSEDVQAMPTANTTLLVGKHVFPTMEGHPALSDFDVRFMSPNTAIALYHRSELGFEGEHFESNAAVIVVKEPVTGWRVAVFTRAPLPEYPGDRN
jgi:hypothetical protein